MRKITKLLVLGASGLLAFFCIVVPASAQVSGSLWKLSSNSLLPVNSTWSVTIPQLGGTGTRCVQVNNAGLLTVSSGACSSGSGGTVSTSSQETAGQVPFWTSTNGTPALLSGGSSNFIWDGANSFLGLGTTTPDRLLSIGGNVIIGASTAGGTNGALTYGGVTFANTVTGTGSLVGGTSPTFTTSVTSALLRGGAAVTSTLGISGTNSTGALTSAALNLSLTAGVTGSWAGFSKLSFNIGGISLGTTTGVGGGSFDIASSTSSTTFRPQLFLTDSAAGNNLKHWIVGSEQGSLYIATSSDIFATSTLAALTITPNSLVGIGTNTPGSLLSIGGTGTGINFLDNATSTFSKSIVSPCFAASQAGPCFTAGGGTVTNVATNFSLTGGPITTTGTLSVATSSLYTGSTGQTAYFSGTNAIQGTSTIFTSTASKVGIATTTPAFGLDVYGTTRIDPTIGELIVPYKTASGAFTDKGAAWLNTNGQASSSVRYYDGTAERSLPYTQGKSFALINPVGFTSTTTIPVAGDVRAWTAVSIGCSSQGGTADIQLGNGTASSTTVVSGTNLTTTKNTLSSNNTFANGVVALIAVGTWSQTTATTTVGCTIEKSYNAD